MLKLNEDLFDDVSSEAIPNIAEPDIDADELELSGPAQGEDTGIANVLHDLIIDAHKAVQNYNNAIANLENHPEIIPIIEELANDSMHHIGKLEVALKLLSPNAENIEVGEEEANQVINDSNDDFLEEGLYDDVDPVPQQPNLVDMCAKVDRFVNTVKKSNYDEKYKNYASKMFDSFFDRTGAVWDSMNLKEKKMTNKACSDLMNVLKNYGVEFSEQLDEDTVKRNGKWENVGDDGSHGKFDTKEEADEQRKAMFANGYHESLEAEESLKITKDDMAIWRAARNGIKYNEISTKLTKEEIESLADSVIDSLHNIDDIRSK